jgi:hypothetical protein
MEIATFQSLLLTRSKMAPELNNSTVQSEKTGWLKQVRVKTGLCSNCRLYANSKTCKTAIPTLAKEPL